MQTLLILQKNRIGWRPGSGSAPPTPGSATVTIPYVGPQGAAGDVPILYTTTADTICSVVMFPSSDPIPAVADFGGGGAAIYQVLGDVPLTQASSGLTLSIPDGLDGIYRLALLPENGSDTDIAVSGPVTLSTVLVSDSVVGAATRMISVDSESVGSTDSAGTFTAKAGTDRLIVGVITYLQFGPAPTAVGLSLGAQTFTQAHAHGSTSPGLPKSHVFYLADADIPAGADTLAFTTDNPVRDLTVTLVELAGVDQLNPIGATKLNAILSNVTTTSDSITTLASGSLLLSVLSLSQPGTVPITLTSNSGNTPVQVPEHVASTTDMRDAAVFHETVATAGAVQHDWAWAVGARYYTRLIEIRKPA